MGLLKKSIKGEGIMEDIDGSSASGEDGGLTAEEELYMKLYMKIGRDFVHKEDLYRILKQIIEDLDMDELDINIGQASAEQRAEEYKHFLSTDKSGTEYYPDLIDLNKE